MSAPLIIAGGDLLVHDPEATKLYHFNWAGKLGPNVTIAAAETLVSILRPRDPTNAAAALAALTVTNEATHLQLHQVALGTPARGAKYEITSRITTTENPPQTLDGSFLLLGQDE